MAAEKKMPTSPVRFDNSDDCSRPCTPVRKSKQAFVFEFWRVYHKACIAMVEKEDATFQELTKFLRRPDTLVLTAKFLSILESFVHQKRLEKGKMKPETQQGKLILSSLMITKFPQEVLDIADPDDMEAGDPMSTHCYHTAQAMLQKMFTNAPEAIESASKLHCEETLTAINNFIAAFQAWKMQDKDKVAQSLTGYYEQWARSAKVLSRSSMNEHQRTETIGIMQENMARTRMRLSQLQGAAAANQTCDNIDVQVAAEAELPSPKMSRSGSNQSSSASQPASEPTAAEQLAARGVPAQIRTGGHVGPVAAEEQKEDGALADGPTRIDLDTVIMEEASKKYWDDFGEEIKQQKFHRLFELLNEMLQRLKGVSPAKDHGHIDEIIDVSFIQQTVEHGLIDAKGFHSIFHAIWKQMRDIHAAAGDRAWDAWRDEVTAAMGAPTTTWASLLPAVLNRLLMKLDEVEAGVAQWKKMTEPEEKSSPP